MSFFCCETIIFFNIHNTLHFFLFAFFLFIFVFLMCCGGQVYRCKVSPNGRMIASCSPAGDKSVRVWGMEEGCELMRLQGDDNTWVSNPQNTKHKTLFFFFFLFFCASIFCRSRMYNFQRSCDEMLSKHPLRRQKICSQKRKKQNTKNHRQQKQNTKITTQRTRNVWGCL